jgi:hypothetical protein
LAIGLLVLSLVGGYWIGVDRQAQQHDAAAAFDRQHQRDDLRQAKLDLSAQMQANAPQRAAQADAQAKADAAAKAAADQARAADDAARRASRGTARPTTPAVPIPTSCAAYTNKNQATACALLPQWGFGIDQMSCLVPMWKKESGWNERAENPTSHSYGIPQALPASRMAVYGADYRTNATPQIKWGLSYIKDRYKTPCGAWSFWQAHNWY